MAQNTDNSNTQDVFVPDLPRHQFTVMATSGQGDMPAQPGFNIADKAACDYEWTGYIKIAADLQAPTIQVGADDWATFKLDAFDVVANVDRPEDQIGPAGGGKFYMGSEKTLPDLKKGYYRVHVTYQNINYTSGRNAARLEVLLNGTQISLGELKAFNIMTQKQAQQILAEYAKVDYNKSPREIFDYVDGDLLKNHLEEMKKYTTNGVYDEDAHRKNGDWYNTCALRVSVALSEYGINLKGKTGAVAYKDVKHLGPNGVAIVGATNMTTCFTGIFGRSDFSNSENYLYKNKDGDILCFGGRHKNDDGTQGSAHVGIMCHPTDLGGGLTETIWILYRPTWKDPEAPKVTN